MKAMGRRLLTYGVAGAFVLAVVGWPLVALAIVGILAILVRLEHRS